MAAAVVRREHLDVLMVFLTTLVVLDAKVWEANVAVGVREIVVVSPPLDF